MKIQLGVMAEWLKSVCLEDLSLEALKKENPFWSVTAHNDSGSSCS